MLRRPTILLGALAIGAAVAGCSIVEPDPAGTLSATPMGEVHIAGQKPGTSSTQAAVKAGGKSQRKTANGRCEEVTSWYEGFLTQAYIRDGAERELDRHLDLARARLAKRGWTETETKGRDVYCRPSYPIGFKEWRCFGKVELCVKGKRKS